MYKVLGIDQKEYGPVSAEVVFRWIKEGRANASTRARIEGATEWKCLAEFPEFAPAVAPEKRPPPIPGRPAFPPAPSRRPPAQTCGLAIASLVCACLCFTSLIGLPLGIVALHRIRKSEGRLKGRGLAIAGICVSAVFVLIFTLAVATIVLPELAQNRNRTQAARCVNNLNQLGLAMRMYANDQSDRFAPASNWCDALQGYVRSPSAFLCKTGPSGQRCHYGFNARLGGLEEDRINPKTVLFFEIDGGWNVSGGPDRLLRKARHRTVIVCFADGTVEQLAPSRAAQLRWDP
jgi:hypothetical protein